MNLTGKIVRFAIFIWNGLIDLPKKNQSLPSEPNLGGIGTVMFQSFQLILNFSAAPFIFTNKFNNASQNSGGPQSPSLQSENVTKANNNLDDALSMSHLLLTNKTDIAFGFLYFVSSRANVATLLLPLSDEKFNVYFLQPNLKQFGNPFNRQLSPCLIYAYMAVLLSTVILLAIFTPFLTKKAGVSLFTNFNQYFCDSLSWAMGTWCQQSFYLNIYKKWQLECVINFVTILSYCLYSIYCAVIIATLMQNLDPIRELKHLFKYQYTFFAFGDTKDTLLNGSELIWKPPPPSPHEKFDSIDDYEKYMSIFRLSQFNLHDHVDTDDNFFPRLDTILSQHYGGTNGGESLRICDKLTALPLKGSRVQSGFYSRKGFKFRSEFNYAVCKMRESGMNARIFKAYESLRFQNIGCRDSLKRQTYQDDLGMTYLGSMFTALAISYMIPFFVLIIEFLYLRVIPFSTNRYPRTMFML